MKPPAPSVLPEDTGVVGRLGANPDELAAKLGYRRAPTFDCVAFSPDGTLLAASLRAGDQHDLALFDWRRGEVRYRAALPSVRGYGEPAWQILFAADAREIYCLRRADGAYTRYRLSEERCEEGINDWLGFSGTSLAFLDGGRFAASGKSGEIFVADLASRTRAWTANVGAWGETHQIAAPRDGSVIVACTTEPAVEAFDGASGKRVWMWKAKLKMGPQIAVPASGRFVAIGCDDGTIRLLDLSTGAAAGDSGKARFKRGYNTPAVSPCGCFLLGGGDRALALYEFDAAAPRRDTLRLLAAIGWPHGRLLSSAAFTPDSTHFAVAGKHGIVIYERQRFGS